MYWDVLFFFRMLYFKCCKRGSHLAIVFNDIYTKIWQCVFISYKSNDADKSRVVYVVDMYMHINSLRPSDAYMRRLPPQKKKKKKNSIGSDNGAKPLSEPMLECC